MKQPTARPVIDTHVHLWDPNRLRYSWLDSIPALNRPFSPREYLTDCGSVELQKFVFVECGCDPAQNVEEVKWVAELARQECRLQGIVAQVSLEKGSAVGAELAALSQNPLVKGVRRLLQSEPDPEFCLRPDFVQGVRLLSDYGFTFDLCVIPQQLPAVTALAQLCTEVTFILDHAGKPAIRDRQFEPWATHLRALARLPNVACKLSGLVTEADHQHWQAADLQSYIGCVLDCFGADRVLFGSDWPVLTLASSYPLWLETLRTALGQTTDAEQKKLFHDNAQRLYRL